MNYSPDDDELKLDVPDDAPIRPDYDKDLADEIDGRIKNDSWLSNPDQPRAVVETVDRALDMDSSRKVRDRRKDAQDELLNELPVERIQTIQHHCHRSLFQDYEDPPENIHGKKQWHRLFDALIREIERETRSTLSPQ